MIKDNIIYHTVDKVPMSLRELELKPDCDRRIEYIFYALNISENFEELTEILRKIIADDFQFEEFERTDHSITYAIYTPWGDTNYLKFVIKGKVSE